MTEPRKSPEQRIKEIETKLREIYWLLQGLKPKTEKKP